MTEEQYKHFLYCCMKEASSLHFNNEDGISNFLGNKPINMQPFDLVISKNAKLLKALKSGVCFSMSSWVFELLYSMGLDSDYYFMESSDSDWPNFVILYKTPTGYKICDLAAQVRLNEAIISVLINDSIDHNLYGKGLPETERILNLVSGLSSTKYLSMEIEDYIKEYPISTCKLLLHQGCEDYMYTKVPRKKLWDFLKEKEQVPQISKDDNGTIIK